MPANTGRDYRKYVDTQTGKSTGGSSGTANGGFARSGGPSTELGRGEANSRWGDTAASLYSAPRKSSKLPSPGLGTGVPAIQSYPSFNPDDPYGHSSSWTDGYLGYGDIYGDGPYVEYGVPENDMTDYGDPVLVNLMRQINRRFDGNTGLAPSPGLGTGMPPIKEYPALSQGYGLADPSVIPSPGSEFGFGSSERYRDGYLGYNRTPAVYATLDNGMMDFGDPVMVNFMRWVNRRFDPPVDNVPSPGLGSGLPNTIAMPVNGGFGHPMSWGDGYIGYPGTSYDYPNSEDTLGPVMRKDYGDPVLIRMMRWLNERFSDQ